MLSVDAIIVGGGPAGSSCAWQLQRYGRECIVLDRAVFPRTKLCAGWITPAVVQDLELDISAYPHSFLTFESIRVHLWGMTLPMKTIQHSIRRYEFDHWLLQRAGVPVYTHHVKTITKEHGHYVIDGAYRCRYLVGAGGTRCPVQRSLFRDNNPRLKPLQAVTLEREFPYRWQDQHCHLWFFDKGLPGYSWYVPKAQGYLNVGIGGMAVKLKKRGRDIKYHWQRFAGLLNTTGLVNDAAYEPDGYSYYLRGYGQTVRQDNAFIVGDAAGLATRDLCEGIGPAVKSGLLAANAIALGQPYDLRPVVSYSSDNGLVKRLLEYRFIQR